MTRLVQGGLSPMSVAGFQRIRFVWEDAATAALAVVALLFCVRGRANSVPCAFLSLALPALLIVTSRTYREQVIARTRALWQSLDGSQTPWLAALVFVVIPAVFVYLSNDHSEVSLDTCPVVATASSMVTEGNTDLDEYYQGISWWRTNTVNAEGTPYFLKRRGNHVYSSYPSGMVPFALPVVALARVVGANLMDSNVQLRLEKLTASIVAGWSLGVFFLLALRLVRPVPALATTAILGVASGMWSTVGQSLWQHDGVVLGSLVVLLIEFQGPGRLATVAQGVICGILPACRVTSVAFLVPFGLWVLTRSPRRAFLILAGAAIGFLPWGAYYDSVYGSPIGPSTSQMKGSLWSAEVALPLAGVLVSPGRGLLVYQPWIVLALLSLTPWVRRKEVVREGINLPGGWEWMCLGAVVFLVGIVSAWQLWDGGFCWGSRLVVEVVPLCALLCVRPIAALSLTARGRGVVLGLALLGLMVHVPDIYLGAFRWNAVYAKVHSIEVWSWSHAPFLAPFHLPPR